MNPTDVRHRRQDRRIGLLAGSAVLGGLPADQRRPARVRRLHGASGCAGAGARQRQQVRLIALAAALVAGGLVNLFVVQIFNGGEQTWAASLPLFVSYLLLPIAVRGRRAALPAVRRRGDHQPDRRPRGRRRVRGDRLHDPRGRSSATWSGRRTSGFWLSLLATALVALAFQPLRRRVVRFANRLAYGSRAQPYEALSDFSRRHRRRRRRPRRCCPPSPRRPAARSRARGATAVLEVPGAAVASAEWGQHGADAGTRTSYRSARRATPWAASRSGSPKGRAAAPGRPAAARGARRPDRGGVPQRRDWRPSSRRTWPSSTGRPTSSPARGPGSSRPTTPPGAPWRPRSPATSCPTWSPLPDGIGRAREAVAAGQCASTGLERLVDQHQHRAGGAARADPRRVPDPAGPGRARAGAPVAPGPQRPRRRPCRSTRRPPGGGSPARVEAAVYFCLVEVREVGARPVRRSTSRVVAEDLVLQHQRLGTQADVDLQAIVDRVEAAGGSLLGRGRRAGAPHPGRRGRAGVRVTR